MKIIDFYADWCGPCQVTKKALGEFGLSHKDIEIQYINIEEEANEDLVDSYHVRNLPTLVLLNEESKEIKRHTGLLNVAGLENFVSEL